MSAEHYGATATAPTYVEELHPKSALEHAAPYTSEFIGTFLFVFTVRVCSVLGDPLWNATAIGGMLMVLVYIFGSVNVDGPAGGCGHLNPAVSFATGLAKKEPWKKVFVFVGLQLLASQLASGLCLEIFPDTAVPVVRPQKPFEDTYLPAFVETVYTAVLCFVVLNVGCSRRNNPEDDQNHFFGLAIGLVVIAGGYAAGEISGACFNPAVTFGLGYPFWISAPSTWTFAYAGLQLLGSLLGAFFFLVCRREERLDADELVNYEPPLLVQMVSESLGTFVLVLTVGSNVVMKSSATAWSAAAALACMIYALGDVSGAHFNPAVTFAVMLSRRGKCPPKRAACFMATQLLAGLLASFVIADLHFKGPRSSESFCLKPVAQAHWAPVFWAEFLFTFMLAFVVLAVATTDQLLIQTVPQPVDASSRFPVYYHGSRQNFPLGLAIGSCVTAGGFAVGSVSGGVLNPAVAFGIANSCIFAPGSAPASPWPSWMLFGCFQLAGGMLAAGVFAITHSHEFDKKVAV